MAAVPDIVNFTTTLTQTSIFVMWQVINFYIKIVLITYFL